MKASFFKRIFEFNFPAETSRGSLLNKTSFFLKISDSLATGIGEISLIKGLSIDDDEQLMEQKLTQLVNTINENKIPDISEFKNFPALQFGLETALKDLQTGGKKILYPSKFTEEKDFIKINGLIWMGNTNFMETQIAQKINNGFDCLKLKIGSINFNEELNLLKRLRKQFSESDLTIRLDANGAYQPNEALNILNQLKPLKIHSIEQPIKQNQPEAMKKLCAKTPIPIALDEELIGFKNLDELEKKLQFINPQFVILKPSLLGGLHVTSQIINLAEKLKIGWWLTSALESQIGLNAIAQFTYLQNNTLPQGLGTGKIYTNNFKSPLYLNGQYLQFNPQVKWENL